MAQDKNIGALVLSYCGLKWTNTEMMKKKKTILFKQDLSKFYGPEQGY